MIPTVAESRKIASPLTGAASAAPTDCDEHSWQSRARRELWTAVVGALNLSGIDYCLLGTGKESPAAPGSDMDFVVRPRDYECVPALLARAAASVGAQLIQAIRHESTATYFAIARRHGATVGFLNPDCTTDYRRQGRLWIRAEELLCGRRLSSGGFFRPAPEVDFKYYLIKQVLKQTLTAKQWTKLTALYRRSPDPERALDHWPLASHRQIDSALLRDDRGTFRELLPRLRIELESTPYQERGAARTAAFVAGGVRVLSRLTRPTGLFVRVTGGRMADRTDLALRLADVMAPAFRRTSVGEFTPITTARALVESTLVVSPGESLLERALFSSMNVHYSCSLSPARNLERAVGAVISCLANRTARRLKLASSATYSTASECPAPANGAV